jgi:signal transduction histidine kinase/CheY-like chemotaxis protein
MKAPLLSSAASPAVDLAQSEVSAQGRAKLLDMTYARLMFSVSVMPLVALLLNMFYARFHTAQWLAVWVAVYFVFSLLMHLLYRRYRQDQKRMPADALFNTWRPAAEWVALAHGLLLSAPVYITLGQAPLEFLLLMVITFIAVISSNATHQTPVLSVFMRFLVATSLPIIAYAWALPRDWLALIPLSAVYVFGIYRHAKKSHRFYVQQVLLEETSTRLAAQYKEAKELSENALLEKTRFLTTASHDLRQPVHAIGMMIEAVSQRNQDASLALLLNDLKSGVRSVNFMFNSLLDLSKIESGAIAPRPEAVAAECMMYDITTLFNEEAKRRGLSLRLYESKREVIVNADPTLLRQAIINLVHNALRYTLKGGVLLGVRRRGDDWQLEVWDTGVGVAQGDQASIHSPFYTKVHAWNINDAGHGLGLAVVARCAALMGAQYGMTSRLGRGTRCWLRLPAVKPDSAKIGNVECVQHLTASNLRELSGTCLIVEDDPQVGNAWLMLLQAWGVDARLAADGTSAVDCLADGFTPQAIFCDQRLRSGESGFDLLRALLERCPDAHGAMISGELHSPELAQADAEGYVILKKPLNIEELHAVLSRWLGDAAMQVANAAA